MGKLTVKQERFADAYIISGNATEAAIKAGYRENSARQVGAENLSKPDIRDYIQKRLAALADATIAKQEEVLQYLTSVMRREHKETVVVTVMEEKSRYEPDQNGTMRRQVVKREVPELVEIPAKLSDANKAAELLGRRYGLFSDRVQVEGAVPVVIVGEQELEE